MYCEPKLASSTRAYGPIGHISWGTVLCISSATTTKIPPMRTEWSAARCPSYAVSASRIRTGAHDGQRPQCDRALAEENHAEFLGRAPGSRGAARCFAGGR